MSQEDEVRAEFSRFLNEEINVFGKKIPARNLISEEDLYSLIEDKGGKIVITAEALRNLPIKINDSALDSALPKRPSGDQRILEENVRRAVLRSIAEIAIRNETTDAISDKAWIKYKIPTNPESGLVKLLNDYSLQIARKGNSWGIRSLRTHADGYKDYSGKWGEDDGILGQPEISEGIAGGGIMKTTRPKSLILKKSEGSGPPQKEGGVALFDRIKTINEAGRRARAWAASIDDEDAPNPRGRG